MVERNLEYLKNISLNEIKGFGEKRISSFKKYGINSISDLIRFFPKKHIDRSQVSKIKSINSEIKKEITVLGEVKDVSVFTTKTRLRIATLVIKDETGEIRAKWFGPQYIETRFKKGDAVAIAGIPLKCERPLFSRSTRGFSYHWLSGCSTVMGQLKSV